MSSNSLILSDLKNHLIKNFHGSIKDVILFGSRLHGGSSASSDFDVIIILESEYTGTDENEILDLCFDIDLKYSIIIDAHIISINELNSIRGKQPLFINAIEKGLYA